jgi:uncharacterized protein (TIGR02246 family)
MLTQVLHSIERRDHMAKGTSSPSGHSGDEQIRHLISNFVAAWNEHDAHSFAETFEEDADFTNVIGMDAHGRHAIEEFHAPVFATIFNKSHLTTADARARFIVPDIASVDVRWEMTGATERNGTPIPLREGLLHCIVRKQNEKWLIAVMHNQEFTPPRN